MQTNQSNSIEFLENSIKLVEAMRKSGYRYDYGQLCKVILREFENLVLKEQIFYNCIGY